MPGVFNKTIRPKLAGSYFNWIAEAPVTLPPSIGGIVAIPATSDWGPLRTPILLGGWGEHDLVFGSDDTPLRRAVYGAFKGQGLPGRGGAGSVLVYRMGTNAAAHATKVINNTAGSPVPALTLTALYAGTRANRFRITTQASATPSSTDLLILDGALLVERYTFLSAYASGDADALVAAINTSSDFFSAAKNATGTPLATLTSSAVSGGNDGDTLTSAEWLQAQDAFDGERWTNIAAYNLTDSGMRAAFKAWIDQRNLLGRRSRGILGGAADESLSQANDRSIALNDYNIVNLGVGTLHDDVLGVDQSTAEFTARFAGALARAGESRDVFFMRFGGVSLDVAPTTADEEDALDAGTTIFTRDNDLTAPVFIREGVTSYTDDSQSEVVDGEKTHPVELYKRIKNLSIQYGIELAVDEWAASAGVFGDLPVNDRVRALILGRISLEYKAREDAEVVQPGWTVVLDEDPPPDDDQDYVQYLHGFHPTRSLRQLFNTARIG